jgi:hypothetical protein
LAGEGQDENANPADDAEPEEADGANPAMDIG